MIDLELPSSDGWDSIGPVPPLDKPTVEVQGDDRLISSFASDLGEHLRNADIFVLNGDVVIPTQKLGGFEAMRPYKFVSWAEDWVRCVRWKGNEQVARSMAVSDAYKVLQCSAFTARLKIVSHCNPLRLPFSESGALKLLPLGYYHETNTFTVRSSIRYREDMPVKDAFDFLNTLLAEFPFATPGAKAGVIAAMLSNFCTGLLSDTCLIPAFVYSANDAGCGKGLCAMLATVPIFGFLPTGVHPKSEPEFEKVLFAAARAGQQVLFVDNVDRHIASPSLESFLTASHVSGRVIGQSTFVTYPKRTVVLISGNNITLSGDMRRRSVMIEFFMEELQAEHRAIRNPLDEGRIQSLRSDILSSLFALVRDWFKANRPAPSRVMQGFVEWSKVIAGIVEHSGFGNPVPAPQQNPADEDMIEMGRLVETLHNTKSSYGLSFRDLVNLCRVYSIFETKFQTHGELSKQEKTSFSRLLKRFEGRLFAGGLRFSANGQGHGRKYKVERLSMNEGATPSIEAPSTTTPTPVIAQP